MNEATMRLGIIGLPNSGKTTIFNALTRQNLSTGAATSGQFELHTAVVNVPDARVEAMPPMVAASNEPSGSAAMPRTSFFGRPFRSLNQ